MAGGYLKWINTLQVKANIIKIDVEFQFECIFYLYTKYRDDTFAKHDTHGEVHMFCLHHKHIFKQIQRFIAEYTACHNYVAQITW